MENNKQLSNTLHDIKSMMERSSRFISLSGFSGIAAGICALTGAWFAYNTIYTNDTARQNFRSDIEFLAGGNISLHELLSSPLFTIGMLTFIAAFISAFIFTWLRSRKTNVPIWGTMARRLLLSVCIPMLAGAVFLFKLLEKQLYGFIAPTCLIFYGLALLNASKYTLPEIKYLGYGITFLGLLNLFFIGYGLFFWSVGFGIFHIIYGIVMWWKYERNQTM